MAVFGYVRVSTSSQHTSNQRLELESAGFAIDFWFSDTGISGKTCASQRPEFSLLLDKIRDGETLVVSKLDRLGRDAVDVLQTVRLLASRGIQVIVLQLGKVDLASVAGKLLLTMLVAVAEMERDLLVERTQAGLQRARAQGKRLGRPVKTTDEQRQVIRSLLASGRSVTDVARQFNVSRASIVSIRRVSDSKTSQKDGASSFVFF